MEKFYDFCAAASRIILRGLFGADVFAGLPRRSHFASLICKQTCGLLCAPRNDGEGKREQQIKVGQPPLLSPPLK